eukprot:scaffold285430_cov29-Prasinocladus_malaysianus.AAC.1
MEHSLPSQTRESNYLCGRLAQPIYVQCTAIVWLIGPSGGAACHTGAACLISGQAMRDHQQVV